MTIRPADPGFEDPRDMLLACHEKVGRFTRLTLKLQKHLESRKSGDQQDMSCSTDVDQEASQAAGRILRYFRMAAPLHHQDEELDLFPALLALDETVLDGSEIKGLHADIAHIKAEHNLLEHAWSQIEPWLDSIEQGQTMMTSVDLSAFVELYDAHMLREQDKVFPYTDLLTGQQRKHVCVRMAQRRGLTT